MTREPVPIGAALPAWVTSATTLVVFVPTKLVNPLNAREHWAKRAKRAKAQRDLVAVGVYASLNQDTRGGAWRIAAKPEQPKRIALTAHVAHKMDDDGLSASLKAIRDGLQDCGLIHSDGPDSGHVFEYRQVVKKPTGVAIRMELA